MISTPVDKLVDMLASHVSQYGDGTKRILLMLHNFLRALKREQYHQQPFSEVKWRLESLAQLRMFRCHTFELVQKTLLGNLEMKVPTWDYLEDVLHQLVTTFMSTRFPQASAVTLSDLLFNQFMKVRLKIAMDSNNPLKAIRKSLNHMSQNFARKVILGLNLPLTYSKVLPLGFFLSQSITNMPNFDTTEEGQTNSRFIIWVADTSEAEQNKDTVLIKEGSTANQVSSWNFLKWRCEKFRKFVLKLKQLKVNLIIKSNGGLKDYEKSVCQELDIAVIEYADHVEVKDLASEANILVLTGSIHDNIEAVDEKFVGKAQFPIKEVRLGRHFYTQLVLSENETCCGHLPHIFICGMTQSTTQQYSKALNQCLRLLACSITTRQPFNSIGKTYQSLHLPDFENLQHPQNEEDVNSVKEKVEVINITSFLTSRPSTKQCHFPKSFEYSFIEALNTHLSSLNATSRERDAMLALRRTFEALMQAIPKSEANLKMMQPLTVPYPFEVAIEQINTMLDMAEMLLRIDQICSIRQRIQNLVEHQSDDED